LVDEIKDFKHYLWELLFSVFNHRLFWWMVLL
jgi:hypothetical protein